jgi:hypothetical protein
MFLAEIFLFECGDQDSEDMRKALAGDPRHGDPKLEAARQITADFVTGRPGKADTLVSGWWLRVTDDEERFLITGNREV